MAKTRFSYVEREADSYVNWADVGRTITNTVDEIDRTRTEKKAAIDAAYREELERINNKPIGEKEDVNKWTIDMAYNAAENQKIQYNLLKAGKIQVKDYATYLQNSSDSIKNLYATVGKIQTEFQQRLERQNNKENQAIEMWDGEDLEQYGKITDLGANFNLSGNLSFSRLETVEENGQTIKRAKPGAENLLSVNQLVGAVNAKYNRYDYLKDADGFVKRLGDSLESYRQLGETLKAGSITQIIDRTGELTLTKAAAFGITDQAELDRLKKVVTDYAVAEEEYINSALNPKYNKSSLLTENLGYKVTDNKEEADKDPSFLLVKRETDGTITPMFKPEQEEAARDFLKKQYRQMIDKKLNIETYTEVGKQQQEPRAPTSGELEFGSKIRTVQGMGDEVGKLYSGDLRTRETVLAGFNLDDKIDNMYYEESNKGKDVSIKGYLASGKPINIPYIKNGEKISVYEFANAFAQAIGRKDLVFENDAVWKQALKKHEKYNEDWGIGRENTRNTTYWTPQAPKPKEEAVKREPIGVTAFTKYQSDAAADLNEQVKKYGLQVKGTATLVGYHRVAIFDKDGNKLSGDIKVGYPEGGEGANKAAQNFNTQLNDILKKQSEGGVNYGDK